MAFEVDLKGRRARRRRRWKIRHHLDTFLPCSQVYDLATGRLVDHACMATDPDEVIVSFPGEGRIRRSLRLRLWTGR